METKSLYEKIGGEQAVEALIEDLYQKVLADPHLAPFFEGHSTERIRSMQRELFAEALGGPLKYSGQSLSVVHHGKGIKPEDFQCFMHHVVESLRAEDLTLEEIDQVISTLAVEMRHITGEPTANG